MKVVKALSGSGWVVGLTCLDDELFVLHQRDDNQVEVYSAKTYSPLRQFSVNGLAKHRHNDMTSCAEQTCLFISDCTNKCVHKSSKYGDVLSVWPVHDSSTGLSLTPTNNLLFACRESRRLRELCSKSGECVRQIDLPSEIEEPRYAVQLASQRYIITHCGVVRHRICLVDPDSRVLLSYGSEPGSEITEVNFPTHVAVDGDYFMFVGDWSNRRIVLLSPSLELVRHIELEKQPCRLYLDRVTRRLYVGHVNGDVTIINV